MDDTPVSDLYERYKAGSRRVVQWLAGAAGVNKKSSSAAMSRVALTTNEIRQLAEQLARMADKKGEAPVGLDVTIMILENVVANRAECAAWYEQKTPSSAKDEAFGKKNDGHQHYLLVMRYILNVLQQIRDKFSRVMGKVTRYTKNRRMESVKAAGKQPADVLTNTYQNLTLEEPSPDDLAPALESTGSSATARPHKVEYELEALDGDKDFALWCLFKECNGIRKHVHSLWSRYCKGEISLGIASKLTDLSFFIIRHTVQATVEEFPDLSDFEKVADYLDMSANIQGQAIKTFQYKKGQDGPEALRAAEMLCIPAYLSLKMLKELDTQPEEITAIREDAVDVADWISNSHELTRRMKILFVSRSSFQVKGDLAMSFFDFFGPDIFLKTMLDTVKMETTAIDVVIIYQIYMDIIDLTQDVVSSFELAISRVRQYSDDRILFFEKAIPKLGRAFRKKFFKSSDRDSCRMRSAVIRKSFNSGLSERPIADSFGMAFPTFAGKITREFTMSLYRDGVLACDEDTIGMSMAALYIACRESHLLRKPWKDMEFFISSIGHEALGLHHVNNSQSPLLSAAKNYGMALGVPPRAYGKEVLARRQYTLRTPLPTANQIEGRRVRLQPSSLLLKWAQKACNGSAAGLSREKMVKLPLDQIVTELLNDPYRSVDERLVKKWRSCGELCVPEILAVLEDEFQREELGELFDYHSFFLNCAATLTYTRIMTMKIPYGLEIPSLDERLPAGYTTPQMVDEILWEAAEVERQGGGPQAYRSTVLGVIAYNLARDIQRAGRELYDEAIQFQKMQRCDAKSRTLKSSGPKSGVAHAQRVAEGVSIAMTGARVDFTGAS